MHTTPDPTPDPAAAAALIAQLDERIHELQQQRDHLARTLTSTHQPGTTIHGPDGAPLYRITTSSRFDPDKARNTLPPHILDAITTSKLDAAKLKELSPALYRTCTTPGTPHLRRA